MANTVYLQPDKRAGNIGAGIGGLAVTFMKQKAKEKYLSDLLAARQTEEETILASGATRAPDPNVGLKVPLPRILGIPAIDTATQIGLVKEVFRPPSKEDQDELVSYFKPPAVKGQLPELVKEQRKGLPRPAGAMTREEIASFLQFPSEGAKPTEKELDIGAEYRQNRKVFTGVSRQDAFDRVRTYKAGENDLQKTLMASFGIYDKDTGGYKWDRDKPKEIKKANDIEKRVKAIVYSGEQLDVPRALSQAYDEFGVEPPMKEEPPAPPPPPKRKGVIGTVTGWFDKEEAPTGTPAPAPVKSTPIAPISSAPVEEVSIGAIGKVEVKVPTSVKGAPAIHKYIMETYKTDSETAKRLILRHAAKP